MKRKSTRLPLIGSISLLLILGLVGCADKPNPDPGPGPGPGPSPVEETKYTIIDRIQLDQTEFTLDPGESVTPEVSIKKKGSDELLNIDDYEIVYQSDFEEIATYIDGVITALAEGNITVTARIKLPEGIRNTNGAVLAVDATVNVNKLVPKPATAIHIVPGGFVITSLYRILSLAVVSEPYGAIVGTLEWTSSNDNIAQIEKNKGFLTGKMTGTVTVTVTNYTKTCTDSITVTVVEEEGGIAKEDMYNGYYKSIKGLKGEPLRKELNRIVRKNYIPNYDWDRYEVADESLTDVNSVTGVYSRQNYLKSAHVSGGKGWNREHSYPQSFINRSYPSDSAESISARADNHHIYASDNIVNGNRGSLKLGEVNGGTRSVDSYGYPTDCYYGGGMFEPGDSAKGEVARATMYLVIAYTSLSITTNFSSLATCFEWHENNEVEPREIRRNDAISYMQLNRNPFIDFPELARMCFDTSYTGPGAFN